MAYAASLVLAAVLATLLLMSRWRQDAGTAGGSPVNSSPRARELALAWDDTEFEVELLALEADLLLPDADQTARGGSVGGSYDGGGANGGGGRPATFDDVLFELELDLLIEQEELRLDSPLGESSRASYSKETRV